VRRSIFIDGSFIYCPEVTAKVEFPGVYCKSIKCWVIAEDVIPVIGRNISSKLKSTRLGTLAEAGLKDIRGADFGFYDRKVPFNIPKFIISIKARKQL